MESPLCPDIPVGTLLIETFGWHPGEGARRLEMHLTRMQRSAKALGFVCDRDAIWARVAGLNGAEALRCRLTLAQSGEVDLTTAPLGNTAPLWQVALAAQRLEARSPWLFHKTTQRQIYDAARAALSTGVDELLFLNQRDELCEGTITNLFLRGETGPWLTPAIGAGLLPGILRQHLLETGAAHEAMLTLDDLRGAAQVAVGNSLRGLIAAEVLF